LICSSGRSTTFNGLGALHSSILSSNCHRASSKGPPRMRSATPLLFLSFPAWPLNFIMGSRSRWLGSCRIWSRASTESALMRNLSPYFCGKQGRMFRESKHIDNEPKKHWIIPDLSPFGAISNARERRLGLANRLLDRYQLALRSGSFE
jgi:hypothetical protein